MFYFAESGVEYYFYIIIYYILFFETNIILTKVQKVLLLFIHKKMSIKLQKG